ncbi:hypothetical protein AVEN_267441-1, partial [Araneus ventricosus]
RFREKKCSPYGLTRTSLCGCNRYFHVPFLHNGRRKKVGKFDEELVAICCPLKGPDFFPHTTFVGIQARRHRPPRSPTREGSHRLWVFPASALTLVLAGTYTLRITPGDSDHP